MTLPLTHVFAIMLGGATGALMRFLVATKVTEKLGSAFPYGTLTVNVIGSFVFGFLAIIVAEKMSLSPVYRLGIFVGFLGAFTTFSTFSMETLQLFEQGFAVKALLNMLLSVCFSVFAVWLGFFLGKTII